MACGKTASALAKKTRRPSSEATTIPRSVLSVVSAVDRAPSTRHETHTMPAPSVASKSSMWGWPVCGSALS